MRGDSIVRIVLLAILAFVAYRVVLWLLGILLGTVSFVIHTAIVVAVILAVIWLMVQIFTPKKNAI